MTGGRRRWLTFLEAGALFGVALAVRLKGMPLEPNVDELNHVLAARQYLADGTFSIAEGEPYHRAWLFTVVVAWFFQTFGDSLLIARLPAVLAGSLAPVLVYALGRSAGERAAGLIAGALLSLDSTVVLSAQWARFYPFQLLAFLLATLALYHGFRSPVVTRPWGRWVVVGAAAVLALLALHFQIASIIGLAGMALALAVIKAQELRHLWNRRWRLVLVVAAATMAVGLASGVVTGAISHAWGLAWYDPPWASGGGMGYYFASFLDRYPLLWSLFPLLLLLGAKRNGALTTLTAIPFVVVVGTHTVLPWGEERFVNYITPHFLLSASVGIVEGLGRLRNGFTAYAAERALGGRFGQWLAVGAVAFVVAFAAAANRSFVYTGRMVAQSREARSYRFPGMGPRQPPISWSRAAPVLRGLTDSVSAVVSPNDLKALYFLGRLDYVLNLSRRARPGAPQDDEFGLDPKTGRPLITLRESLRRLVECHPDGVIIAESWDWRNPRVVTEEVADFVESDPGFREIALPRNSGLVAYVWNRSSGRATRACPDASVSP